MATEKQEELLNDMIECLDDEFDYGKFKKKKYYNGYEAYELIRLNSDAFWRIKDSGQCTPRQYKQLKEIAGRDLKYEREFIGFSTAVDWLTTYGNKNETA